MISIIGTRPQYVKVAAIDRYCKRNGIDHKIIDTRQHYSEEMSGQMIDDLGLKIEWFIGGVSYSELGFITNTIDSLRFLENNLHEKVLLYGDTNSTFCAALVCFKLGIPFGHVEAGARTGANTPEEVNRIFADQVATHNFCTTELHAKNVRNGVVSGSLEYELLNKLNPTVSLGNYNVLTIHRQSNMGQVRFMEIMEFIKSMKTLTYLPLHHRLANQPWFHKSILPDNVVVTKSLSYSEMIKLMAGCMEILTDSGGIAKTAPFFGKKTLILREENGWKEVVDAGYAKLFTGTDEDRDFLSEIIERDKRFYMEDKPASEIICTTMTT